MSAILTEDHLRVFQNASPRIIDQAVTELMLEDDSFDYALFKEFLKDFRDADGDLVEVLSRTHKPIIIEEFVTSKTFLGMKIVYDLNPASESPKQGVYKGVLDAAKTIVEGNYVEALLMGAIGLGKTTLAQIVQLYDLYVLSTHKYPQLALNLIPGSPILFACLNVTDALAKNVTYGKLRNLIERCPYFRTTYPFEKRQKEIAAFPNNIRIMYSAANADKLLGEDVLGGIVDELNFMKYVSQSKRSKTETGEFDQAQEIYKKLVRRRASRFMNAKIGRFSMVSSKGYAGDFTELRKKEILARENAEDTHKVFMWEHAQWEVKPDSRYDTEPKFVVQIGDERAMTRVLADHETAKLGSETLIVPIRYKEFFITDPEGSLRDFGGRSAKSSNVYFKSREDVWYMPRAWKALEMVSPYQQTIVNFDDGMPDITEGYQVPYPDCARTIHVDLAISGDRCGVACGFVLDLVSIKSPVMVDGELTTIEEKLPFVVYDFALGINPPRSGNLTIDVIRHWIYYLKNELKIPIDIVTMDGFQSVDMRQVMRGKGYQTDHISVEDLGSYEALRSAMHQKRVAMPEHLVGFKEILELVPDFKKKKCDHPPNGGKDVADAICGVYKVLGMQRINWQEKTATGRPTIGARPKTGRR